MATLEIDVRAKKNASVRNVLKGTVKDAKDASKELMKIAGLTEEHQQRQFRKTTSDLKRETQDRLRWFKRLEEQKRAAAEKTAREMEGSIQGATKRSLAVLRSFASTGAKAIAGIGAGAAVFGFKAAQSAQSLVGVRSQEELFRDEIQLQQKLIRLKNAANLSDEEAIEIRKDLQKQTAETLQDQLALAEAFEIAQASFDDPRFVKRNLALIGKTATAKGTTPAVITQALGVTREAFGITEKDVPTTIGLASETSDRGAIEFADIAGSFAPLATLFATITKQTGLDAARQFFGTSQILGRGRRGPEETATQFQALLNSLVDTDVQEKLQERNIRVRDKEGKIDIARVVSEISQDKVLSTEEGFQEVFKNIRAASGLRTLIVEAQKAREAGEGNPIATLAGSDAQAGLDKLLRTFDEQIASPSGQALAVIAEQQSRFSANSENLVAAATTFSSGLTSLQSKFPLLTRAMGVLKDAIQVLIGSLVVGKLLGAKVPIGKEGVVAAGSAALGAGRGLATKALTLARANPLVTAGVSAAIAGGYLGTKLEDKFGLLGKLQTAAIGLPFETTAKQGLAAQAETAKQLDKNNKEQAENTKAMNRLSRELHDARVGRAPDADNFAAGQ